MGFNLGNLPSWALGLLSETRVARLGLLDEDGAPRVLPVTFALADGAIWTAIDDKPKRDPSAEPARVRFLRRDPRAALIVDRYSDEWDRLAWVQVLGEIRIVDPEAAPAGMLGLAQKYDAYRASPPPGPLLRLDPIRCLHWRASD